MRERIEKLNEYLIGWTNYFKLANTKTIFEELSSWVKRRLRACLLKQWKHCKTKLRMLMKLGSNKDWAACIAYSRKGYWRLSATPQMHKFLGNEYWRKQGLVDICERYKEVDVS